MILLKKNSKQILEFINSISSLIIIEGEVNLSNNLNNIKLDLKLEEGVHIIKGSSFQISSNNDSKILVASTDSAPFKLNKNLNTVLTHYEASHIVSKSICC